MPLSRRYSPEVAPGESSLFGMDFSFVIPAGAEIASADVTVYRNMFEPTGASADWEIGDVQIASRAVYARLSGGVEGVDYKLVWTVTDTDGNVYPRTALLLCAQTS
ncbi:MAG TPA: hypothetical protein VF748_16410 [Candidatus Acidoferrum sp.]